MRSRDTASLLSPRPPKTVAKLFNRDFIFFLPQSSAVFSLFPFHCSSSKRMNSTCLSLIRGVHAPFQSTSRLSRDDFQVAPFPHFPPKSDF